MGSKDITTPIHDPHYTIQFQYCQHIVPTLPIAVHQEDSLQWIRLEERRLTVPLHSVLNKKKILTIEMLLVLQQEQIKRYQRHSGYEIGMTQGSGKNYFKEKKFLEGQVDNV